MKTFIPPKSVSNEAKRGLKMYDLAVQVHNKKCATRVGLTRANQLSNQRPVSLKTIKRINSFLARHEKNKNNPPPKCGMVSYLLWGGDSAKRWVSNILSQQE